MVTPAPFGLNLPPLNESETHFVIAYMLQHTFQGRDVDAGQKHRAQILTFLRLVEHVVREYKAAHRQVNEKPPIGSGLVLSPYITAASSLETCLTAMHRAASFLPILEETGVICGSIPQVGSIRGQDARDALRDLRNAVQHLDKRIMNGNLKRAAIAPATKDGLICIGNERLPVDTLLNWLGELNRIAGAVIGQVPQP